MSETGGSKDELLELLGAVELKDDRRSAPELATLTASQLERFFAVILPLVGVNTVLVALAELRALAPAHRYALDAATFAAGVGGLAWGFWGTGHRRSVRSIYTASGFGFLLLLALARLGLLVGAPVALGLAYAFTWLVRRGDAAPGAVALYLLYVTLLPPLLGVEPGTLLTAVDALTVIPMIVVFLQARIRLAAVAAIVAIAALAWRDRQSALAVLVLGAGLVLAVVYEIRIPDRHVSQLRMAIDHALIALLAYVLLRISPVPSALGAWPWAAAVLGYEVVQAWRERLRAPARLAVAAAALAVATWGGDGLAVQDKITVSLICAAALGAVGAWARNGFVGRTALLVAVPGAAAVLDLANGPWAPSVLVHGALTTALGLLVARERFPPAPYAWWRGFVREEHVELLKRVIAAAGNAVLRLPIIGPLLQAGRAAFGWVRQLGMQLGVDDVLHGGAHVYGALVVSAQVRAGVEPRWAGAGTVLAVVVWGAWGAALVELGVRGGRPWRRVLGVAFALTPWLVSGAASGAPTPRAVAAVVTGVALALAGASMSRARIAVTPAPAIDADRGAAPD